jgi:membrane-bound inhibitor of C-type lysozyme
MNCYKFIILAAAVAIASAVVQLSNAAAQTFRTYRCADGTEFAVGFYDDDARAFIQIDGKAVTLGRRISLSGSRYSGGGITLKIGRAGTTVKHAKRPATACAPIKPT